MKSALMDAVTYRRAWKYLSARQWRKKEPGEPTTQEPELLRESLEALYRELGEHPLTVCERLHFKPKTFKDLTGIDIPKPGAAHKRVVNFQRSGPARAT